jgi:hypothetical protein
MRGFGSIEVNGAESAYHQGVFNNPVPASTYDPLREVADGSLAAVANIYQDRGMTRLKGTGQFTMASLDMKSLVIGGASAFLLAYLVWGRKR